MSNRHLRFFNNTCTDQYSLANDWYKYIFLLSGIPLNNFIQQFENKTILFRQHFYKCNKPNFVYVTRPKEAVFYSWWKALYFNSIICINWLTNLSKIHQGKWENLVTIPENILKGTHICLCGLFAVRTASILSINSILLFTLLFIRQLKITFLHFHSKRI